MSPLDMQRAAFSQGAGLGGAANVGNVLGGLGGMGMALQGSFYSRPAREVRLITEMQLDLDKYLKDWDK